MKNYIEINTELDIMLRGTSLVSRYILVAMAHEVNQRPNAVAQIWYGTPESFLESNRQPMVDEDSGRPYTVKETAGFFAELVKAGAIEPLPDGGGYHISPEFVRIG